MTLVSTACEICGADLGKREVEADVDDSGEEEEEEEADDEQRLLQHRQPVEGVVQLQHETSQPMITSDILLNSRGSIFKPVFKQVSHVLSRLRTWFQKYS